MGQGTTGGGVGVGRGFSLDGLVDAEASTYISIREPRIPPVSPQPAARPYNPDRGSSIIDTTIAMGRRTIFPFGIVWLAAALLAGAVAARAGPAATNWVIRLNVSRSRAARCSPQHPATRQLLSQKKRPDGGGGGS
jgi:hypothetical protein